MYIHPSGTLTAIGYTHASTGALGAPDSLPTGQLYHNGVVDGAVTVTVTLIATGKYKLSCTIGAYSEGDIVQLEMDATVANISDATIVQYATVCSALPAVAAGANGGLPTGDASGHVTLVTAQAAELAAIGTPQQAASAVTLPTNAPSTFLANDTTTLAIKTKTDALITVPKGTVLASPTPATNVFTASGLGSTANEYVNSYVYWLPGSANVGATPQPISASTTGGQITCSAFAVTPVAGDTFVIIGSKN